MERAKILIVDDEKETRHTSNDYISNRIECDIAEAENGYEAIEKIKNDVFDLILLDIKMPGISGIEVIKEAKSIFDKTSIIVLTKWDSSKLASQVKESGADYIPKPFSLKVVCEKVEEKIKAVNKFAAKN